MKKLFGLIKFIIVFTNYLLAYDFSAIAPNGQTLYYNFLTDSTVELIAPGGVQYNTNNWAGYIKPEGTLILPSSVNYSGMDYLVTSIADATFSGCDGIGSVTIPNTIKYIGHWAFSSCTSLNTINCPNTPIELGQWVFLNTGWENAQPQGVVYLNNILYCYKGDMPANYFLTIPSYINSIAGRAFSWGYNSGYSNLVGVTIPNSVEYIGAYAFFYCSISNVVIPSSVKVIAQSAFAFNNISEITIPSGVTYLGSAAFQQNGPLTTVNYNAISANSGDGIASPFIDCQNLTTISIGNDIQQIPNNLFRGCSNIHGNITLPNSLISVGDNAFYGCEGLVGNIIIPNATTNIGQEAFCGCTGITSVTIGTGLTSLGGRAFDNMNSLTTINYNATDCINNNQNTPIFQGNSITSFSMGSNVHLIPDYLICNCPNLNLISFPNSLTQIGSNCFANCGLTGTIVLPESLTRVGYMAFTLNNSIDEVYCYASTPPTVEPYYGYYMIFTACLGSPLYVPCESISAYQSAPGWSNFTNITCIDDLVEENLLKDVVVYSNNKEIIVKGINGQSISVYGIDGRIIKNMDMSSDEATINVADAGVYIVKIGVNTTRKIVVQ